MTAPTRDTIDVAADALVAGMRDGTVRNRNRRPFKPSVIRDYERCLNKYLRPEFGSRKLSDIRMIEVQEFADALLAQGLDPSTVKNALMPLRVIYRRAVRRGECDSNPTRDLDLPASEGTRERVASADEARLLIEALPEADRALWAIALYAGPRAGELQALQAEDIDLEAGLIHVRRSWDKVDGFVATKGNKERAVPICEHLRAFLPERGAGFYLGTASDPFNYGKATRRAYKAWEDAGLERITLHECRHTFRSYLDAIPAISEVRADSYLGHANHSMRARYSHSFDGQAATDAAALDEYLTATESSKLIQFPIVAQAVAQ